MFVHLHCHSDRTIGKSLIKPFALVEHYKSIGAKSACITDNGNLNSAIQLFNACRKFKIKPIFGIEVNVTKNREIKDKVTKSLVLLAKDIVGFRNLVKIATAGSMFFYYTNRVDLEIIKMYHKGVICLTSDIRGYCADRFFLNGEKGIEKCHEDLSEIFGKDLYWEIQPNMIDSQRTYNEAVLKVASSRTDMNVVASGDPHYLFEEDRQFHVSYLDARNSKNPYWVYPFKMPSHVLSEDEICFLFDMLHGQGFVSENEIVQNAIWNSIVISESVSEFDLKDGVKIPCFL